MMTHLCLENYGVTKLETQEMKATNGGIAPIVVGLIIVFFLAGTQKAY